MISSWTLLLISAAYVGLLFAVASWGERNSTPARFARLRPLVYALALAVYCSSWTFYGAVGTAARTGLGFLPIYLGPILLLIFGWRILERLILTSDEQRIVSIADFLSSRYGRVPGLAALVTLLALVAAVPYVSLQYKAVAMSVGVLTGLPEKDGEVLADPALYVALSLALFAILFGTRRTDATEHHRGMMLAVAMESLLKLVAFIAIGLFALWHLPGEDALPARILAATREVAAQPLPGSILAQTVLAFLAIVCLPRQFHVAVVECEDVRHLRPARWLFGAYLALFSLLVVPPALTGRALFGGGEVSPDSYVLAIPMYFGQDWLTLAAYLGGFSAATGMVIMASIALATMVSNDLVMPVLLRLRGSSAARTAIDRQVLWVRRATILALALFAFAYHRAVRGHGNLAEYGLLTFAAVAQFAPALIGGLYWRGASRDGALAGTLTGAVLWTYTLFLPSLVHAGWLDWRDWLAEGPFGLGWLRPEALFGMHGWDALTHGMFWSLLGNGLAFLLVSMRWRPRLREHLMATAFLDPYGQREPRTAGGWAGNLRGNDLLALAERIVGEHTARRAFAEYRDAQRRPWQPDAIADRALMQFTERLLASAIGADSARLTLTSALRGSGMELGEVVNLLDQAGQDMRFNREMLTTTLENISQAVSVVDADLRLVTWNRQYQEMFGYPDSILYVGRPIADLIRWNAEHGEMGEGDADTFIERRITHLNAGTPHVFERVRASGQVIEMRGRPLPGGGYVTTFSDITAYKQVEQALREANETLEQRVELRTREAESAQQSKTRFLAAVSHDLLQPLNAARLFTSALRESHDAAEQRRLGERVDASLRAAEDLLDGLLDISRLDANELKPDIQSLDAGELLRELAAQYAPIAQKRGLGLRVHASSGLAVRSDHRLLRRALQNFIANAMRYTRNGGVLLAARRRGKTVELQVWDTGAGIHAHHLGQIFEEFRRFAQPGQGERGLGLGLSICQRIARTLDHRLQVHSRIGRGSVFSISVPHAHGTVAAGEAPNPIRADSGVAGLRVLSIDNDPDILDGMRALLSRWQVEVRTASDVEGALATLAVFSPQVLVVDFHLHDRLDGLQLIDALREAAGRRLPAALLTGDGSAEVKEAARMRGVVVLTKPVKPASLRAFLAARHD
ncbi:response regulator [Lysobacter pythonis]|uniref:histidine kinase n=1 Tax=Solilutibacter pythonis TaxID=2483112 RepID=A0A3M2HHN5_9GAMM|nr:PAS domain-containing hybrid sensor histidine kinase/response regulator [Lysobacter pythonis]RMH87915.1 response regulator [Lysobacter pythonis]